MSDRRPANPPQLFTEDIPFFKQAYKNVLCIQCDDIKIEVTIEILRIHRLLASKSIKPSIFNKIKGPVDKI